MHQRLKLIQEAHNCDASEARRRLWTGEVAKAPDHWSSSLVTEEEAVADVKEEEEMHEAKVVAVDIGDGKENREGAENAASSSGGPAEAQSEEAKEPAL